MKYEEVSLTPKMIKQICEEYMLKEGDELIYDDEYYNLLKALAKLDRAEFIIFCLYAHYQSERKTAKILGLSRTPIHKALTQIREKINKMLWN
jgi:hypothetical protein